MTLDPPTGSDVHPRRSQPGLKPGFYHLRPIFSQEKPCYVLYLHPFVQSKDVYCTLSAAQNVSEGLVLCRDWFNV